MSPRYDALDIMIGDDDAGLQPLRELVREACDLGNSGHLHEAYERLGPILHQVQDAGFDAAVLEIIDEFRLNVADADLDPVDRSWLHNYEGLALLRLGHLPEARTIFTANQSFGIEVGDKEIASNALLNLGNVAFAAGELDSAGRLYAQCAQMKLEIHDVWGCIQAMLNLATVKESQGELDKADNILTLVEEMVKDAHEPEMKIGLSFQRAKLCINKRDFDGAEKQYRRALLYARRAANMYAVAMALRNIATTLADQGDLGQAIRWYRKAIALAETLGNPVLLGPAHRAMATTLHRSKRNEEAVRHFEQARAYAASTERQHDWATDTANLGALWIIQGRPDEAIALLEEALPVFLQTADRDWQLRVLWNLLAANRMLRRVPELTETAERLLGTIDAQDYPERARVLRETGNALAHFGGMAREASAWIGRSLEELRLSGDERAVAWSAAIAGALMHSLGHLEEAFQFFTTACEIYVRLNERQLLFKTRNDRGNVLAKLGRLGEAREELDWCLQEGRELDDYEMQVQSHSNLGEVMRRQQELDEALAQYDEAFTLAADVDDKAEVPAILCGRGLVLSDLGRWEEAEVAYKEALSYRRRGAGRNTIALSLRGLGSCHSHFGRFARAKSAYSKAVRLFERDDDQVHLAETLGALAVVLAARNELTQLESVIQGMINLTEEHDPFIALLSVKACAWWTLYRNDLEATADLYVIGCVLTCKIMFEQEDADIVKPTRYLTELYLLARTSLDAGDEEDLWHRVSEQVRLQYPNIHELVEEVVNRVRQVASDMLGQGGQALDQN